MIEKPRLETATCYQDGVHVWRCKTCLRVCDHEHEEAVAQKVRHYVGASKTLTACGRQRNKLSRGSSAFEWDDVNCPRCIATRAPSKKVATAKTR